MKRSHTGLTTNRPVTVSAPARWIGTHHADRRCACPRGEPVRGSRRRERRLQGSRLRIGLERDMPTDYCCEHAGGVMRNGACINPDDLWSQAGSRTGGAAGSTDECSAARNQRSVLRNGSRGSADPADEGSAARSHQGARVDRHSVTFAAVTRWRAVTSPPTRLADDQMVSSLDEVSSNTTGSTWFGVRSWRRQR